MDSDFSMWWWSQCIDYCIQLHFVPSCHGTSRSKQGSGDEAVWSRYCLSLCHRLPGIMCFVHTAVILKVSSGESGFRWSRGSMLAFGTQVRGFKSGRSLRIFKGEKILSTPSFGGEVKPSVPCRRFAACKRSLNVAWKSTFRQNYGQFLPTRRVDVETPGSGTGNIQHWGGGDRVAQ
jgi:hypothetical protein